MTGAAAAKGISRKLLVLLFCIGWLAAAVAQVPVPALTGHVIDQTATLNPAQMASLEETLSAFEARKGSQIAALMVASTAPEEIEQFALRVAEQWKLGRKRVDDGVIVVVAKNDRAVRIEVGYGLEGVLTDITSKRIISETMLPRFRGQDYFGGISAGVGQIIRVVDGEPLPAPSGNPGVSAGNAFQQFLPAFFILALVVGSVLRRLLGKLMGSVVTGGVVAMVAWFVLGAVALAVGAGVVALLVTLVGGGLLGRSLVGYYGGMGGHGHGGGFGGGGGGFGGGGASGRW